MSKLDMKLPKINNLTTNRNNFLFDNNTDTNNLNTFNTNVPINNLNISPIITRKNTSTARDPKSEEFFMRKSHNAFINNSLSPNKTRQKLPLTNHKNFNDTQILKTDILQIDNLIKKNSEILFYFEKDNYNTSLDTLKIGFNQDFMKRTAQISNSIKTSTQLAFQELESKTNDIDILLKDQLAFSKEELIKKIAKDNYMLKLFINRLNDLAFVVNLNYNNEENRFITDYRTNNSNFYEFKVLIENFTNQTLNASQLNNTILSQSENLSQSINICKDMDKTEYEKILALKNISELIQFKTENEVVNHINSMLRRFFDKFFAIFSDFLKDYDVKLNRNEEYITTVLLIRENFEKLLHNKSELVKQSNKTIENLTETNKINQIRIDELLNKESKLELELKSQNQTIYSDLLVQIKKSSKIVLS